MTRAAVCAALALAFGVGCTTGSSDPCASPGACEPSFPDAGPTQPSATYAIEPGEAEVVTENGSTATIAFTLLEIDARGGSVEVTPERWYLEHERFGTIDREGVFTANGRAGGAVGVLATVRRDDGAMVHARATLTVRVRWEVATDVSGAARDGFDSLPLVEDPSRAVAVLYPLDASRMPNNVAAPEVHWDTGDVGDAFRVVLSTQAVEVSAIVEHTGFSFGYAWPVDQTAWRVLAESTRSDTIEVRVDRLGRTRTDVVRGLPVRVWLSDQGVFGQVYYWRLQIAPPDSDVYRLDPQTGERTAVFDTEGEGCVGCHTVSRDGRWLAGTTDVLARVSDWATAVVDVSSATLPAPELFAPIEPSYNYMSFSPDATRIVATRVAPELGSGATALRLVDTSNGTEVSAVGLPATVAGYPSWSPDGTAIAYMTGTDLGLGPVFATSISVVPVLGGDRFGESVVLHDGSDLDLERESGLVDSHPTWSPDSRWIAFAHGTSSVSFGDSASPRRSALYMIAREGGEAVRLSAGMGRSGTTDAFWPVFSPFVTVEPDGQQLYWLAFYSRQDYGNEQSGTRGTRRRQLWVMAIDPSREDGVDGSYAPFWLPGQDTRGDNVAAYWAPSACREQGEECTVSSECCSGTCTDGACHPPTECRMYGSTCSTDTDCCDGLVCNLNVCGYTPPI